MEVGGHMAGGFTPKLHLPAIIVSCKIGITSFSQILFHLIILTFSHLYSCVPFNLLIAVIHTNKLERLSM